METLSMPAEIRLRVGQWAKFCKMRGWLSENQQARELKVAPSTINRILKGTQKPSGEFIGAALLAFPELEFADLFEVVNDVAPEPLASAGFMTIPVIGSILIVLEVLLLLGLLGIGAR